MRRDKSLRDAFGLMVNYRYDLKEIEKNHEAYVNEGTVAASRAVRCLLEGAARRPNRRLRNRPSRRRCRAPQPAKTGP